MLVGGICLLTFVSLVDPSDQIFHLKIPLFALVMLVWMLRWGVSRPTVSSRTWMIVLGIGIAVPLLWTVFGIIRYSVHSPEIDFGTLKSFLFLLLMPVLLSEDIDLASLVVRIGFVVAFLTFVMVGVSLFFRPAFDALYAFSMAKNDAIITTSRHLLGFGIGMFYYKTSPLLVFPFSYYCRRATLPDSRKTIPLLWCAFYGAALLFSGARANFLSAVFIAGVFAIGYLRRKAGYLVAYSLAFAGTTLLAFTVVRKMLNPTEQSNSIKLLHMMSYMQLFNAHPLILLWGQGADTAFYSRGFEAWTTVTELSYLELIRVFGIPVAALLVGCLLWICLRCFRKGRMALGLAFVAYLFICGTNPLLISSTGFIAICAVWKEVERPSTFQSAFHLSEYGRRASGWFASIYLAWRRGMAFLVYAK